MKPRPWSLSSSSVLACWATAGVELEKGRVERGRDMARDKARRVVGRGMVRRLGIVVALW